MKRLLYGLGIIILLAQPSAAAEEVILLSVDGDVQITGGDDAVQAQPGSVARNGQVIESRGGTAKLMFADGKIVELAAGKRVSIEASKSGDGTNVLFPRLIKSLEEFGGGEPRRPTIKGMVRAPQPGGPPAPPLLTLNTPCASSYLYRKEMTLSWIERDGLARRHLSLQGGKKVAKKIKVPEDKSQITFSTNAKEGLQTDKLYRWRMVGIDSNGRSVKSRSCWFSIMSEKLTAAIQTDLQTVQGLKGLTAQEQDLLKANTLLSYGAYAAAAQVLRQYPRDKTMRQMLTRLSERRYQ